MFKDDDEEEENTFGVTRYPCMPSLVALQQMRNRLHLAFLGRKLMKWTALATGRELRRLAQELYEVYDGFAEDLRNAFILLARSRYFYPHLNSVVTEDIGKKAGVVVQQCGRTVSGVKIVQFEIYETEYPPYPHLGLEKGGQTIMETKKAWLELLKRLIMMMQLRAGFLMVELANRNANKKMNVLKRIVIPRTNLSVGYILTELEEIAREEFHRLKKVKEKKRKDYELRNKKDESKKEPSPCRICEAEIIKLESEMQARKELSKNIEPITIIAITPGSVAKPDLIPITCTICEDKMIKTEPEIQTTNKLNVIAITPETPAKPDLIPSSCQICEAKMIRTEPETQTIKELSKNIDAATIIAITPESAAKPDLIRSKTESKDEIDLSPKVTIQEPEPSEPFVELYTTLSGRSSTIVEKRNDMNEGEDRLEYLKRHLNELIALGKEFLQTGVDSIDINEFLKMCEEAKLKLEQFFTEDNYPKAVDTKLERKLEHLKCHLREVIDITKEFKPEATLTSSVENFIKMCEDVDEKLDIYKQGFTTPSTNTDNDKVRLEEFKDIITDVENITKEYNKKGLLSPSVETFLKSCCDMKAKVDKYMCCKKNKVTIAAEPSIEKQKSEVQPRVKEQTLIISPEIQNLIKYIDDTIDLGMEARQEGLISDSAEDFIKSFDELKSRITARDEKSEVLQNLQLNIDEIMNLIERLKADGKLTESVEDFLKLCLQTKDKLNASQERSPSVLQNYSKANSFSCIDSCHNKIDENQKNKKPKSLDEERPLLIDIAPCESCTGTGVVRIKDISKESLCITCSRNEEDEDTTQFQTIVNSSEQSQETLSELSNKDVLQSNVSQDKQETIEDKMEPSPSTVDSNLGYFEKKLQKKVKITRTRHSDGTIWEQKETITIKKKKHDPTETSLTDDDDDISDETSDEDINEQVNVCLLPNHTQRGFIRNFRPSRSDSCCKYNPYVEPCLRYCLSVDNFYLTTREQMPFYNTTNLNEIELLNTDLNYMNYLRHRFYDSQN